MQVWNVLPAARWKYMTQKWCKKNRHLCTIAQFCRAVSSQLRHVSTIGKNLLNSNTCSTCPHNIANFGPLTVEIGSGVWGTVATFSRFCILPSLLQQRRSLEANQTLCDVWPFPRLVHYIYISGGSCPLMEFCGLQNLFYVQVLHSPVLASLLYSTPAAGMSQALRHGTRNGIMQLLQRAPPIFGWAAITLGIGPHSSFFCCFGLVSSVLSQEIGWDERLRNDRFRVKWYVEP